MKKENLITLIMTSLGVATGILIGGFVLNGNEPVFEIILSAVLGAVFTFIFRWIVDSIGNKKN